MKLLPYLFLLFLGLGSASADTPAPAPQGIIILKAVAGYESAAISFAAIQWTDTNGGFVTDTAGAKTSFVNRAIDQIIYFDQAYYDEIDRNQNWINWRAGIQNRETVVNSFHLTSADVPNLQAEEQSLEGTGHRDSSEATLIAPLIALLKDDIRKLSGGFVLQNGEWMTQQEANNANAVPVVGKVSKPATFTTKDGKQYVNVKVTVTDAGLSVLSSDGETFVPLDQLPDDLSVFSETTRAQIQAAISKKQAATAATSTPSSPGFFEGTYLYARHIAHRVKSFFFDSSAPSSPSAPSASPAPSPSAPNTNSPAARP